MWRNRMLRRASIVLTSGAIILQTGSCTTSDITTYALYYGAQLVLSFLDADSSSTSTTTSP